MRTLMDILRPAVFGVSDVILSQGHIMDAHGKYEAVLGANGIPLGQFNPGSCEYALDREAAMEAVQALEGTNCPVLGGDVVKIADDRLQYTDNWFVERKPTESDASFATRSRNYALRFVEEYLRPTDWKPRFVLVTPRPNVA